MSTEVKRRYGTTAQHATFAGAAHETTIDTTKNTVVVHDGATAGGFPLQLEGNSRSEYILVTPSSNADVTLASSQYSASIIKIATGSWAASHNVIFPNEERAWYVINSSAYTATCKTSAGASVAILAGTSRLIVCDATDILDPLSAFAEQVDLTSKIQFITASVGSNALTITLNPTVLDFRSSTIGSGTVNTRVVSSAISVVVSSGSTLGTTNAVQNRLAVLAIDNAGTVELAVVNMAGANNLDETTLISTTAEGGAGAADSASTIYSTTARTNVPFRVVGFVESTQATAGTWVTAPSTIQGAGGNAMTAMSSLGYGMTPSVTALSTTAGTTNVVNSSGKPKFISVYASGSGGTTSLTLQIDGVTVGTGSFGAGADSDFFSWVIPPGKTAAIVVGGNNFTAGNYIIGG